MVLKTVVLAAIAVTIACGAASASTRRLGPPEDYSEQQQMEYWIGGLAGIMRVCGHNDRAKRLRALANNSPYGRKGLLDWSGMEAYRGNCGEHLALVENYLSLEAEFEQMFDELYDCDRSGCTVK